MDDWKHKMTCLTECPRCHKPLNPHDSRILSCYDNEPICMDFKKGEEARPDYEETSKRMIGRCMTEIELNQGDPESYCFNHFYPYKC